MRQGRDITLIGCGIMVFEMLEAAEALEKKNISAEVINIPTIKPIDRELIKEHAKKTGTVFTCEEHSIIGGLGSAVLEVLEEERDIFLKRIGIEDTFGESGLPEELFEKYGLSSGKIGQKILKYMKK